ncbi:MAG: hypothetical protein N3G20_08760 [Verrucomicrobiae bacterium]|nr:hypothetical protein [Verrucomicrobiae bacterium]
MKTITWLLAVVVCMAVSTDILAQGGPGPRRHGYGGPPKSQEERATRRENCPLAGQSRVPELRDTAAGRRGYGIGQGKAYRRGLRDGTGPRAMRGLCPYGGQPASKPQN